MLSDPLGLHLGQQALTPLHMVLRAVVCYGVLLVLIRLSNRRFLARGSAFDVVLAIVLGSVASRAINGNAPFFPTIAATVALVALHELLAAFAYRSHRFGTLVKGHARLLVRDGEIIERSMRRANITCGDLDEALREHGLTDVHEVDRAWLERSGFIAVIPAKRREREALAERGRAPGDQPPR
jgi:uncharacterized membrane protein YcaP (DUF421 family)